MKVVEADALGKAAGNRGVEVKVVNPRQIFRWGHKLLARREKSVGNLGDPKVSQR